MDRGRRIAATVLLAMGVVAGPCRAQTVQKCVGSDGSVTFTSAACPTGQDVAGRYDAAPEPPDPARSRRLAELERWKQADDARRAKSRDAGHARARSRSGSDSRHARCEAAKRHRDAQLERLGLRRTHDDLRRLDGPVREACR